MKLKSLVGLSLIIFGSCVSLIMFVALVLLPSTRVASSAVDPGTGLPVASDDLSSGILSDNSGSGQSSSGSTPTPGTTATPKPAGATATTKPGTTVAPPASKTATPAAGIVTPKPVVTAPVVTTPTPPPVVYCGGAATCYGRSAMAAHASVGNCWAYIGTTIYNMTSFGGVHSGGRSTVENSSICGGSAVAALNAAPTNSKHTSAKNNTQTTLLNFKVGTYDPNKP